MKLAAFCLTLLAAICQGAEDIDAIYAQGIDKLRAGHLVPAAKLLAEASDKYEAAGNDAAAADAASALFWCRKKFSLAECTALHSADEKAAVKAEAVVTRKVEPSNAEKALAKANSFAAGHQDDQLLVAIKYFEVASLYKGSDLGFKAMDLSLTAMGKIKNEPARAVKVAAKPGQPKPVVAQAPANANMAALLTMVGTWNSRLGDFVLDAKDDEFHLLESRTGNTSNKCVVGKSRLLFKWADSDNCLVFTMSSNRVATVTFYFGFLRDHELSDDAQFPKANNGVVSLTRK